MKSNLLYIIGGIVLFAGIIFSVVGFGIAGFDLKNLGTQSEYQEKTFISTEDVKMINAIDKNVSIEIISSNDEQVHITYFENSSTKYNISESNGAITVTTDKDFAWTDHLFNFTLEKINLLIAIPENYSGNLQIKTSNASISINDATADEIMLTTSNSKINVELFNSTGDVMLDTSNGSINLDNLITKGDIFSSTSNSKINVKDIEAENIQLETSNGKIISDGIFAMEGINFKTSNSSITFNDLEFSTRFICKTSNGSVDGMLKGSLTDYSITSDTSNGDNSLPENMDSGDRTVNIKTSNGHIDVGFEN